MNSKAEAIQKQEELKAKLLEINLKLGEINDKAKSIDHDGGTDPETVETFLADYRLKLDQLELLIANLTSLDTKGHVVKQFEPEQTSTKTDTLTNSWKALIGMRLKRAKDIITKFSSLAPNRPTTATVTKYLPTSNLNQFIIFIMVFVCFSSCDKNNCPVRTYKNRG